MLSAKDKQLISVFLFNAGHANVRFIGKHVVYRDQTKGFMALDKLIETEAILETIRDYSLHGMDKLMVRLVMLQVDPSMEVWSRWGDWDTIPDQVYEMSVWTNNPAKLMQLMKDDIFESSSRLTSWT